MQRLIGVLQRPATPDPAFAPQAPDPAVSGARQRLFSIGQATPTPLLACIEVLEQALGRTAEKPWLPLQPGGSCRPPPPTQHCWRPGAAPAADAGA